VNEQKEAGNYKVDFIANKLASGIYFLSVAGPANIRRASRYITETKKLIL